VYPKIPPATPENSPETGTQHPRRERVGRAIFLVA